MLVDGGVPGLPHVLLRLADRMSWCWTRKSVACKIMFDPLIVTLETIFGSEYNHTDDNSANMFVVRIIFEDEDSGTRGKDSNPLKLKDTHSSTSIWKMKEILTFCL